MSNILINNKYSITKKIGSGSFGTIYQGIDINTKQQIAIKIEAKKKNCSYLYREGQI